MGILSEGKQYLSGYKFVGINMPSQTCNYLALYSLAKDIPKSKIISDKINQWIKEKNLSESELLNLIVKRLRMQFIAQKKKSKPLLLLEFKKEIKIALISKGLKEDQISFILKSIKE